MVDFATKALPTQCDAIAPDGSDVRLLLGLERGGMAHFQLPPGQTATAVTHRTVEEIWYFLSGRGQMWRQQNGRSEIVNVYPGVALTIPLGTHFQFRSSGNEPLTAIGVTMPPWPGDGEAIIVTGPWQPTVPATEGGPGLRGQGSPSGQASRP
jgi:mannose-6-phosphate isomerase-like protein (cupin superfamily)